MCYAIPAPHIIYRGALHKEAVLAHDPLVAARPIARAAATSFA